MNKVRYEPDAPVGPVSMKIVGAIVDVTQCKPWK